MSIYKGEKNAALLKNDRSVVELYKGDTRIFGYNSKASGETICVDNVHPVEHKMRVSVKSENLADYSTVEDWVMSPIEDIIITDEYMDVQTTNIWTYNCLTIPLLKANTTYVLWFEVQIYDRNEGTDATKVSCYFESDEQSSIDLYNNGDKATRKFTYTPTQDKIDEKLIFVTNAGSPVAAKAKWKIKVYEDPTAITVTRCGKNLFKFDKSKVSASNGAFELTENGAVFTGNAAGGNNQWTSGMGNFNNGIYLKAGQRITISADYTWLDISNFGSYPYGIYLNGKNLAGSAVNHNSSYINIPIEQGEKKRISYSYTIKETGYYNVIFTLNSCKVKIENVQISYSNDTEYEEYKGDTYTPISDGTVEGITSTSPHMTVMTDTDGAVIECEYVKDE